MNNDWDSTRYDHFARQRERPSRDLLSAIDLAQPNTITDLGCGSGLSTALLADRWPQARILGLDSSPAMLNRAQQRLPRLSFQQGDITHYRAEEPQDLIFANASLHWLSDHQTLLPGLVEQLNPGGVLAVQMPDNLHEASHRLMDEVAAEPDFAPAIGNAQPRRNELLSPEGYYDVLGARAERLDIWVTRYLHSLESVRAIVDWFATTGLKPYLDALPEELRAPFKTRYEQRLQAAYEQRQDGRVLLALPRLFIVAQREK